MNREEEEYMSFKKFIIALASALAIVLGFSGMHAQAAPTKMADGTLFDAEWYAAAYPDVVAAFCNDPGVLYAHYVYFGKAEGRLPYAPTAAPTVQSTATAGDFDVTYYATKYPDVAACAGYNPDIMRMHYELYGKAEGRFPNAAAEMAAAAAATPAVTPAVAPAAGVTIANLPASYMAIAADLTIAGAGNGYHGKVVLKTPISAISFGIQYDLYGMRPYNGKAVYICENVGSNAIGGQVYTRHGLAPVGQTVTIMEAYDTATGLCYLYVNGELVGQVANTFLLGQDVYACVEVAGRDDGSQVVASFSNIRFKKAGTSGTNGDSVMFLRTVSTNPGLSLVAPGAEAYQFRSNYSATAQGTIVGLGPFDWDSAYHSVSATAEFAMFM
jgi:hypothetical protein